MKHAVRRWPLFDGVLCPDGGHAIPEELRRGVRLQPKRSDAERFYTLEPEIACHR